MSLGGARPGAGRKKGVKTIQSEKLREFLIAEVLRERGPIVTALIEKAKTGDVAAIREVFERAIGKVKESMEIETVGEPLNVIILRAIEKVYGKSGSK